jgi:hypothetical protein
MAREEITHTDKCKPLKVNYTKSELLDIGLPVFREVAANTERFLIWHTVL